MAAFFFSRVGFHAVCVSPVWPWRAALFALATCSLRARPPPSSSCLFKNAQLMLTPMKRNVSDWHLHFSLAERRAGWLIQFPRRWLQRLLRSQCLHDKSHFISFVVLLYSPLIISFLWVFFQFVSSNISPVRTTSRAAK